MKNFAKINLQKVITTYRKYILSISTKLYFLNIRIEPALDYFVEMTAVLPNELLISQQARDLGNQLIKEMNINRSYGMANFLGVNSCYDNHQAVLIWTFQLLEREPALNELAEIKKYFLLIFPDSVYQLA